jgi:hypothetical protein
MASVEQKFLGLVVGYPDNISIHGNAKSANSEYVRTTPTVMTNIKDKIEVTTATCSLMLPFIVV